MVESSVKLAVRNEIGAKATEAIQPSIAIDGFLSAQDLSRLVLSFGSALEQIQHFAETTVAASIMSENVIKAIPPQMRAFAQLPEMIEKAIPKINLNLSIYADALLSINNATDSFSTVSAQIMDYFDSFFNMLKFEFPLIDWSTLRKGHKAWGKHGWVVYDSFPYAKMINPPSSLDKANVAASQFVREQQLNILFEDLGMLIHKHKDVDEAIWLYKQGRYKSCAMMLFSLMECELYKADARMNGRAETNSAKRPLNQLRQSEEINVIHALTAEGAFQAFSYFFKGGGNFNRVHEGEINRHFLMHGMMYNPVRRRHCIKLFVLLHALGRLLHE